MATSPEAGAFEPDTCRRRVSSHGIASAGAPAGRGTHPTSGPDASLARAGAVALAGPAGANASGTNSNRTFEPRGVWPSWASPLAGMADTTWLVVALHSAGAQKSSPGNGRSTARKEGTVPVGGACGPGAAGRRDRPSRKALAGPPSA